MEEIVEVLEKVDDVIDEFKNSSCKLEEGYNIFRVLEVGSKEVMMCRVLADMLNPEGNHGQGTKYLKTFMADVLGMEITDKQLATARVYKEYPIKNDRRIDIVIRNEEWFVPIEVKIHAGEQKSQCYDYYKYAVKRDENAKVVYLTKWGTMPSKYSMSSYENEDILTEDRIICISFLRDICSWLENILISESGTMEIIIRQYLEAIHDFAIDDKEELKTRITDKIMEKEEYFRAALEIEKSMKTLKAGVIYQLFVEFEKQMEPLLGRFELEKEQRFLWYDYREQTTEDFYNCYSTYPGLSYVFRNIVLPDDKELWIRIEVEHRLYFGLCVFDAANEKELETLDEETQIAIMNKLNISEINREGWWNDWWYLPTGTDNEKIDTLRIPDFKKMNEAAVRLSDADKLHDFVRECVCVIERIISKLLK